MIINKFKIKSAIPYFILLSETRVSPIEEIAMVWVNLVMLLSGKHFGTTCSEVMKFLNSWEWFRGVIGGIRAYFVEESSWHKGDIGAIRNRGLWSSSNYRYEFIIIIGNPIYHSYGDGSQYSSGKFIPWRMLFTSLASWVDFYNLALLVTQLPSDHIFFSFLYLYKLHYK